MINYYKLKMDKYIADKLGEKKYEHQKKKLIKILQINNEINAEIKKLLKDSDEKILNGFNLVKLTSLTGILHSNSVLVPNDSKESFETYKENYEAYSKRLPDIEDKLNKLTFNST